MRAGREREGERMIMLMLSKGDGRYFDVLVLGKLCGETGGQTVVSSIFFHFFPVWTLGNHVCP